jgi:hypothetical protein
LVSDYAQFDGMFQDPGTQSAARNVLSTVHAGTVVQKTSKPEELAEAFAQDGVLFFDPSVPEQVALMTAIGGNADRNIYCIWPLVPKSDGLVYDNGYIHLPEGHISSTGVPLPLDAYMTQNVRIDGGATEPRYEAQVVAVAPTSVTFTQSIAIGAAADGELLGTLTTDLVGPAILTLTGGADLANATLVGNQLYAVGAQSADLVLDFTVMSWVGYDSDDTNYQYIETGISVDLTV